MLAITETDLVGKSFIQNSGVATITIIKVLKVNRDVATCNAMNVKTRGKGNVKIDLRTGNEYLYDTLNPLAWKGI